MTYKKPIKGKRMKKSLHSIRKKIQLVLCNHIPLKFIGTVDFPHPFGIVIASDVKIGAKCLIYQNVTIGRRSLERNEEVPTLGDNVVIYPGAVVFGGIKIENNVVIGANSVINCDVPEGMLAVGHNKIYKN